MIIFLLLVRLLSTVAWIVSLPFRLVAFVLKSLFGNGRRQERER